MKMNMRFLALSCCFVLLLAPKSFAVTIGQDDFDANRTFTTYGTVPADDGLNGYISASGSRFDRWGIGNRVTGDSGGNLQGLPFDLVDESLTQAVGGSGLIADDDKFILRQNKNDNVFLVSDLDNPAPAFSGTGTVTWTFDISGYENISVSMDWAALGNFDTNDSIDLLATIDAGAPQLIMDGDHNSGNLYATPVNDAGQTAEVSILEGTSTVGTFPAFENPFWNGANELDWLDLINGTPTPFVGAGGTINFSQFDNDQDGYDDTYGVRILEETNPNGTFDEGEFDILVDTLNINGTDLGYDFQTITAPVTGTGSTLTLSLTIETAATLEYVVFDNLLIEGDLAASAIVGDYDGNGSVGQGDLDIVLLNWGGVAFPGDENALPGGGPFDGSMGQNELDGVLLNWGNTSLAAAGAVPEPTTLMMCGLGLALVAGLRRKAA